MDPESPVERTKSSADSSNGITQNSESVSSENGRVIDGELSVDPPYLSFTDVDRDEILTEIGIDSFAQLETDIPDSIRSEFSPEIEPYAESEVLQWHTRNSSENVTAEELVCFLGGGIYDHFVPSTVLSLMYRDEFLTSYTPYQAEINQGTLQGMFEFQSMICELVDLPVTNASMYDGATAFAEAVLMAVNKTDRDVIYYSPNLFESWIGVLTNYAEPHGWELRELPSEDGVSHFPSDWGDEPPAAVCMAYPNRWGCADSVSEWESNKPDDETVGIAGINPLSLGLLTPPGEMGWEVAVGEGQSLGLPMQCGAPQLGLFSASERFLRHMPGRLVGETEDRRGRTCYVLTLQTREQHIRRERATSNICTNHALLTLGVAVSLASMGSSGIRRKAALNYQNGQHLKNAFESVGFEVLGDPVFNEVTLDASTLPDNVPELLAEDGWMGGYISDNRYISAATERRSHSEINSYAEAVKSIHE